MDKTVRLWHMSRDAGLFVFQHLDFVTSVLFHPKHSKLFLTGSLDSRLRLWNIKERRVMFINDVRGFITTTAFSNDGRVAIAGAYDGKVTFFYTEGLHWITQIHVRSSRGKNRRGKKITGIELLPDSQSVLITSNDSRVRLYSINDYGLACKYRGLGLVNKRFQIKANFSQHGEYIACGSEDGWVYLWDTRNEEHGMGMNPKQALAHGFRRDRSCGYEAFHAHTAPVTAALFWPPARPLDAASRGVSACASQKQRDREWDRGNLIITCDAVGNIGVFENVSGCFPPRSIHKQKSIS